MSNKQQFEPPKEKKVKLNDDEYKDIRLGGIKVRN